MRKGYAVKFNPFNKKREVISFAKTRVIVFWSKFPQPIIQYLNVLEQKHINYYFLYTVNDYPEYELHVPTLDKRIQVFKRLSNMLGAQRVIWRFDPLIISDQLNSEELLCRIEKIGQQLKGYTKRLVFSFVDLHYLKVQRNLKKYHARFFDISKEEKLEIAEELKKMTDSWDMDLRSCASPIDFSSLGIRPNKCIDDELMVRLFAHDKELMDFLGYQENSIYISRKSLKDKGQRPQCGCIYSKDIGAYNTCPFECIYCYANNDFSKAREFYRKHNYLDENL